MGRLTTRLPLDTVRDLLGITRALYRAWKAAGEPPERLAELEEVGRQFKLALELGCGEVDTLGHRAAWSWAERATQRLGELVGDETLRDAVTASQGKLRR